MTNPEKQPRQKGLFLPPLLLLILSAIGLLGSLLLGGLFMMGGAAGFFEQTLNADLLPLFSMGWTALFVGALFILPLVQSIQQLTGRQTHYARLRLFPAAAILMALCAPVLFLGQWIARQEFLPWLLLPLLSIFLVAAPILFLIEFARRKLAHPEGGGGGTYAIGVVITQPLVLAVEIIGLLALLVLAGVWLSTSPELMSELERLSQRLMDAQVDPRLVEEILRPYLSQPGLILAVMAVGAGIVPLLEELLKPLAVWVMAGRRLEEPGGFVLGLYAGGTFALLESLGAAVSAAGADWSAVIGARLGTGVMHITTAALTGWGLAQAWRSRKYVRLGLLFLLAFTLHSLWNILALSLGLQQYLPENMRFIMEPGGTIGLIVLAVAMVLILFLVNRHLQKKQTLPDSTGSGPAVEPAGPAENILQPGSSPQD